MDIQLHPQFAENHLLYLTYTKPLDGGKRTTAVARGRLEGGALTDVKDIFVLPEASTSRIAFGSDGMLYLSTTGRDPQDPNTLGGKVLRLRDDGSVPPDNPFVGQADHRPEVYTLGHRSALGLTVNPITGEMWENENGPNGGDEINILKPGRNYGWPLVSYGRTYQGPWQVAPPGHIGFEPPIVYLESSNCRFRHGILHRRQISQVEKRRLRRLAARPAKFLAPGIWSGSCSTINGKSCGVKSLLREFRQRIRDVRQGPDGFLYLLTDAKEGAVLRIEPAE